MRRTTYLFSILVFAAGLLAKDYRGAELRTIASYTYGRYEVRMKSALGSGVISSFFTYVANYTGLDSWNEIDIEWMGRYTDRVQFNTITPGQVGHEHLLTLDFDPSTEFHTYAFEWTPVSVTWFIDDQQVYTQQYPANSDIITLNRNQKIMMNIWPSNAVNWAGTFNGNILPVYAYYDWVKYYSFTSGTGNAGTNNDFTFEWEDNFNTFDSNRWQKASHTWDGNLSDFTPTNCVFLNGFMILCLTTPDNTGFHGDPPVTVEEEPTQVPQTIRIAATYPNPFNDSINIAYDIPSQTTLQIHIFDTNGHLIEVLQNCPTAPGRHTIAWSGQNTQGFNISAGLYFIRIESPRGNVTQKILYLP